MTSRHSLACIFKKIILASGLLLISLVVAAAEKVVVMTSYPQEMISQVEAGFEQQFPQYRLEVLWKTSNDTLNYLAEHPGTVDVYWAPARQNFSQLAKQGKLQKLDPSWIQAPASLHGSLLNDPQGFYAATEVAGLGMVIAPAAFSQAKCQPPQDWQDLANPALQGMVAFPLPTKIGFAGGLVDAMLRGKSWADGWAMLTRIALNAHFIEHGSTFITDEVVAGRAMVGITMDFFAASAIAKGAPLQYRYPPIVSYSPAHVALLQEAPHQTAAAAFAQFTLSPAGQALLFLPDIRKLPVDPAAYARKPPGYFNPYAAPAAKDDAGRDVIAQHILNAFFEASLVRHQALLQSLWVNINFARHLHRDADRINDIEQQLLQPLFTEQALFSTEHLAAFQTEQTSAREQLGKQWSELAKVRYQAAANALQALLLNP